MNALIIILIVAAALIIAASVFVIWWRRRMKHYRPTGDKTEQLNKINNAIKPAGFAYSMDGDYFYSLHDCWQREAGYCKLYDDGAPLFNMIIDCEPITFTYGGKRWLIELWKGQYGITTGGEVGIYNTVSEDIHSEKFSGTFYEAISDDEMMPISYVLRRRGRVLLERSDTHWWLTGFALGEFSHPKSLRLDVKLVFPNQDMCTAFVGGLTQCGYRMGEYFVQGTTVSIKFKKPHSKQPLRHKKLQKVAVQKINKDNCKLYEFGTEKFTYTLDKVEFLMDSMPELFGFFVNSLYGKGFFEAFSWLKGFHHRPKPPTPRPPVPPIMPEPPCKPDPPYRPDPPCRPEPPYRPEPPCRPESPCRPNCSCEPDCSSEPDMPYSPDCSCEPGVPYGLNRLYSDATSYEADCPCGNEGLYEADCPCGNEDLYEADCPCGNEDSYETDCSYRE